MESDADREVKRAVYLLEIRCTPKIEITVDHAVACGSFGYIILDVRD
jgi:hypothetical protein